MPVVVASKAAVATKMDWCRCGRNLSNCGDLIGPYLYRKWQGRSVGFCGTARSPVGEPFYITCGSNLNNNLTPKRSIVWGTGVMSKTIRLGKPKEVHAVRGKITQRVLQNAGIACPSVYGDPGLLMPLVYDPRKDAAVDVDAAAQPTTAFRLGLLPHYVDYDDVRAQFADTADNVIVIDLCRPLEQVIDDIVSCTHTLSSSLHGLVLSHAYSIPTAWAKTKAKLGGDNCKFPDHYSVFYDNYETLEPLKQMNEIESFVDTVAEIESYPQPDEPIDLTDLYDCCPFSPPRKDETVRVLVGGWTPQKNDKEEE